MKTKKACTYVLPLLIAGLGISSDAMARDVASGGDTGARSVATTIGSEVFIAENLGFGTALDVYRVTCNARCIQADVNDTGPFDDTIFKVAIVGSSPGFTGNASINSPKGGLSAVKSLCRGSTTNASLRAYLTYSEVNAPGPENYDTVILCRNAAGGFVNPTVVKILDQ